MRFALLDRIVEVQPGARLRAVKAVSAAEEYLADHFPTFAVLPGVFMLEAMVEAAAWLVRSSLDFAPSLVLLKEAKNITYKSFVRPGDVLEVDVQTRRLEGVESEFSGAGTCGGKEVVRGRFVLSHLTAAARGPGYEDTDRHIVWVMRERFRALQS
ncbi:MAG: beta-hydroxyacyl-ACP dehydratase [Planctomycetota bacterium]|nr:MAG: beta-hydroxyacyl-ACP dehydratase [Planctomycetota bacterium]